MLSGIQRVKLYNPRALFLSVFSFLLCTALLTVFSFSVMFCDGTAFAEAEKTDFSIVDSFYEEDEEKAKTGIMLPVSDMHVYWDHGLYVDGKYKRIRFKLGGSLMVDSGSIDADEQLMRAFSGLDGSDTDFRQARIYLSALLFEAIEARFDMDFANTKDIKDNWIRITKFPILDRFRFGHIKEPFSLEELTSSKVITFMERALPNQTLGPGRNIGIRYDRAIPGKRMTWAAGVFFNTGSFINTGEVRDQIDESSGYSISFRITGLPLYSENGRRLLHLGLSLNHIQDDSDTKRRLSTFPESTLTNAERLVDTGEFNSEILDSVNPEVALVVGPLSVQGEYLHTFVDAAENLQFWGFYLYGSYFLTGEHRKYSSASGTFSGVDIRNDFHPLKGTWGAFELGVRYSYIDLNNKFIQGGKERNITLGLNWYLYPKIRTMFNYIHANVKNRLTSPAVDNAQADIFMVRLQFAM